MGAVVHLLDTSSVQVGPVIFERVPLAPAIGITAAEAPPHCLRWEN